MQKPSSKFSILLVDDDPLNLTAMRRIFIDDDYSIYSAQNAREALILLRTNTINFALVDYKMPEIDGLEFIKRIVPLYPELVIVMLTAHGGVKEAVEAMKAGAVDFIEKPYSLPELHARVAHFYKMWNLKQENKALKQQIQTKDEFSGLIGNTEVMMELKKNILNAAKTDVTILILGESGTGKEIVARLIHMHSPRAFHPFIPIDCGAMNESLIENELFGHISGSFTGAQSTNIGLIRSANSGTLFLDEIGELSAPAQAKLLRTLQEREVRPIGSDKRYKVDIKVIAATNRDLEKEVLRGNFRQDLFFRLNVYPVMLPPLRNRKGDIEFLTRYFITKFADTNSMVKHISQEATEYLKEYDWPGNVRELENVIRRCIAQCRTPIIEKNDLIPILSAGINTTSTNSNGTENTDTDTVCMLDYEETAVRNALVQTKGNRRKAAQLLGVGEATLYRKIKKFKIV